MDTFWLGELANESLGNFDATPEIDRDLSRRALRARHNRAEAWALFRLLAWKINRFAGRYRRWRLAPWELADIVQETYFVFLDTLRRWSPRFIRGRPVGYLYYFLAVFPRWLQNAVRSWNRHRATLVPFRPEVDVRAEPDGSLAVIDDFCAHLDPDHAELLRLRLTTGASVPRAAATLGIPRSRAYTHWHNIIQLGREYMREAG